MTVGTAPVAPAGKSERSMLRSAAVPTEHGGWGLTADPIAVAAPLVGVELWFDTRSRSRRLVSELEADTHLHVHKENNVLFPAVLDLEEDLAKR